MKQTGHNASPPLTIVGFGASAGGLEAFSELLGALPVDTGMAFIFTQHFKPDRQTMLPEILRRHTDMPVVELRDGMTIEANHVYIMSAYIHVAFSDNVVHVLDEYKDAEKRMPIDGFFRALADNNTANVIGVILSGTATDGTLGLAAIKESNGITMAQSEQSARYDGMPHSAIVSGIVDFVLGPSGIARELVRLAEHPELSLRTVTSEDHEPSVSDEIFNILKNRFGVDFSEYKQSTMARRLKRRMVVHNLTNLRDYLLYLKSNTDEREALYHDLLINVTGFFRDPLMFEELKSSVFPELIKDRNPDSAIRVWVPGCSSGEEVYSLAIALLEFMEHIGITCPIQLFGTDIDDDEIAKARTGVYPENISEDLSEERLKRFFIKTRHGYEISRRIREFCVFSRHDIIKDPPFSHQDLVSCRNLLIYLGPTLQKRIFPRLHFALKPNGYLVLGTAETAGGTGELFHIVEKKYKIYRKLSAQAPLRLDVQLGVPSMDKPSQGVQEKTPPIINLDVRREADHLLMKNYAPAAVVINEDMEIIQYRGHTGPFLEPTPGEANLKLLSMARDGLMPELRAAVREAVMSDTTVRKDNLRANSTDKLRNISVEVVPIRAPSRKYFLVVFQKEAKASSPLSPSEAHKKEINVLEQELAATKEYLQSVIEQQEVTNEELRCANEEVQSSYEELQSSNEELQSTNEELETAKEELQSANEELRTVNEELEGRNAELLHVNDDLENLISSAQLAVAMVGPDLRIRRFTPRVKELLNLIESDIGRPIGDINPNLDLPPLESVVEKVLRTMMVETEEVRSVDGHWYSMRIHPYRTADNRIDGVVISIVDVDEVKNSLEDTEAAQKYAEAIISAIKDPILMLDCNLIVVSASETYMNTFRVSEDETVGNLVYRLGNGQWANPELRLKLENNLERSEPYEIIVEHDFPGIGRRSMSVSGRRIEVGINRSSMVLMQIKDITQ